MLINKKNNKIVVDLILDNITQRDNFRHNSQKYSPSMASIVRITSVFSTDGRQS